MPLFDSAAVRDLLKPPPPGAHDWSVHRSGRPGQRPTGRYATAPGAGVEQPYPGSIGRRPRAPRGRVPESRRLPIISVMGAVTSNGYNGARWASRTPSGNAASASAAPPASPSRNDGRPGRRAAAAVGRGPGRAPHPAGRVRGLARQLPESLTDSRTAELLEGVCDVDLDALDVELPRGFGRD